jgi:putative heme iron utilization protein
MPNQSRLDQRLRTLLQLHRVASLGTISDDGSPFVSMVPFALELSLGCFVIHVSDLAGHTDNLLARPLVSLMVMQSETVGESVHILPRATFEGVAALIKPNSVRWRKCRAAYLQRFPEASVMAALPDFRFFSVEVRSARQVAGFASARSIDGDELRQAFASWQSQEPHG